MSSYISAEQLAMVLGMDPDSTLPLRSRLVSAVRSEMLLGSVPTRLLDDSASPLPHSSYKVT